MSIRVPAQLSFKHGGQNLLKNSNFGNSEIQFSKIFIGICLIPGFVRVITFLWS